MSEDMTALRAACSAEVPYAPEQAIADGESRWFFGRAAPAARGLVALAQPNGFRLTFREDHILEVKRHKDLFFVRLSARGDLLASFEQVVNAGNLSRCDCHEQNQAPFLRRGIDINSDTTWGDQIIVLPHGGCYVKFNCGYFDFPVLGNIYICIPTGLLCA